MSARPRKRERKLREKFQKKFPLNEMKDEAYEDFEKT
jgi:hypothetical protein